MTRTLSFLSLENARTALTETKRMAKIDHIVQAAFTRTGEDRGRRSEFCIPLHQALSVQI